jgi:hypothetical protein
MKLTKDTWYQLTWVDIQQDSDGHVEEADVAVRKMVVRFIMNKVRKVGKKSVKYGCFVTMMEEKDDDLQQAGWWAVPHGNIVSADEVLVREQG